MGDGGLAQVEVATNNTYVAFAARAGSTAEDGDQHSPFAKALIANLATPGWTCALRLGECATRCWPLQTVSKSLMYMARSVAISLRWCLARKGHRQR